MCPWGFHTLRKGEPGPSHSLSSSLDPYTWYFPSNKALSYQLVLPASKTVTNECSFLINYPGHCILLQQQNPDWKNRNRTKSIPLLESEGIWLATWNFALLRRKLLLLTKECFLSTCLYLHGCDSWNCNHNFKICRMFEYNAPWTYLKWSWSWDLQVITWVYVSWGTP